MATISQNYTLWFTEQGGKERKTFLFSLLFSTVCVSLGVWKDLDKEKLLYGNREESYPWKKKLVLNGNRTEG